MTLQPFPVVFPDVELAASTKIHALLLAHGETGVFVGRAIPNPRQDRMVILTRDGGGSDVLDRPRLRVRVFSSVKASSATPDAECQRLAAKVLALAALTVDGAPITSCRALSGPYDVPDESKVPQRYALLELTTRGEAIT